MNTHRIAPVLVLLACGGSTKPAPVAAPAAAEEAGPTADEAKAFADGAEARLLELWKGSEGAHWTLATDITDAHAEAAAKADEAVMAAMSEIVPGAARFDGVEGLDADTARKLALLKRSTTLPAPADATKRTELAGIMTKIAGMYGKGKHCTDPEDESTCRDLGALEKVLSDSTDPAVQLEAWQAWRTVSPDMRADYARFVELGNEGAKEIGYTDLGDLWRSGYDMPSSEVRTEVDRLWGQMQPLYEQLHCYVRAELNDQYGDDVVDPAGPIPAHLLGNMWAQDWSYLYPQLEPFKGHASLDVDQALADQDWDHIQMVKTSEAFFTSIGLDPMPETFWERSMFVKPEGR